MPATSRTLKHALIRVTVVALTAALTFTTLGLVSGSSGSAYAAPAPGVAALELPGQDEQAKIAEKQAKKKAKKQAKKKRLAKKRKARKKAARRARTAQVRRVNRARSVALAQRGDRYAYGATGPHAFDCSGLVQFSFKRAGFRGMPRTSRAQASHTRRISRAAMRPGDLMFFHGGGGVYHVGVFVGRGKGGVPQMVHASRPGTPVQVARPWTNSWFAGTMRPRGA